MRNHKQGKLHMESLPALLVFGVFFCCVVFLLMSGARVYDRVMRQDAASSAMRTCFQYLTTKVRQAPGAVEIAGFGDGDALVLPEEINGQRYTTRVYCYEGWLCELLGAEGGGFSPADGQRVLEAQALELTLEKGLLTGRVTLPDGSWAELTLHVPGGGL